MLWDPTARDAMLKLAWPCPSRVATPRLVPLSERVTAPVGIAVPVWELTVVVKVIVCPNVLGLIEVTRAVVLEALLIVSENAPDEAAKLESPE
jgi:hypothetical protein